MLAIGTVHDIITVHHQELGKHLFNVLPTLAKNIGAITYNSLKNIIFISDIAKRNIIRYDIATEFSAIVDVGDVGRIVDMDFGIIYCFLIFSYM